MLTGVLLLFCFLFPWLILPWTELIISYEPGFNSASPKTMQLPKFTTINNRPITETVLKKRSRFCFNFLICFWNINKVPFFTRYSWISMFTSIHPEGSSVWISWNAREQINDVMLKTFLSYAKSLMLSKIRPSFTIMRHRRRSA